MQWGSQELVGWRAKLVTGLRLSAVSYHQAGNVAWNLHKCIGTAAVFAPETCPRLPSLRTDPYNSRD